MSKSISYQNYLINSLKNPEEAAGYLNAALKGGDIDVFLLALKNIIEAHGGVGKIAVKTQKSRTSLYKTLSKKGNPHLKSIKELLTALNMHFVIASNNSKMYHKAS